MKFEEITVTFQPNIPKRPIITITEVAQPIKGIITHLKFLKINHSVKIIKKNTPTPKTIMSFLAISTKDIISLPRYAKRVIAIIIDVGLCILCTWLAFYLRLEQFVRINDTSILAVLISISLAIPILRESKLFVPNNLWAPVMRGIYNSSSGFCHPVFPSS